MLFTNDTNLPAPIFQAVTRHRRELRDNEMSATELSKPSRAWALERVHDAELVEDASERLFALMGSAGHQVLELAAGRDPHEIISELAEVATDPDSTLDDRMDRVERALARWYAAADFVERRLYTTLWVTITVNGEPVEVDVRLSGKFDHLTESREVTDYKWTSIWTAKDGAKVEWISQANTYAWLCRVNNIRVDGLQVVAIYRDWSIVKSQTDSSHPKRQSETFPLPLWDAERTEEWVRGRVQSHLQALADLRAGRLVTDCSSEERWERGSAWKVRKVGNRKAIPGGVHEDMGLAYAHAARMNSEAEKSTNPKKKRERYEVIFAEGTSLRCAHYCAARNVCELRAKYVKAAPEVEEATVNHEEESCTSKS